MSFGSTLFLVLFLPLAWLAHWLVPRRAPVQNAVLLAVSYAFYATWGPRLVWVLALTTTINYLAMRALDTLRDRSRARLHVLWGGLIWNVGLLVWFKYLGFFANSLNALLVGVGLPDQLPVLRFVLPLGISFWTIQQVAWLLDVYHGRPKFRPDALEFAVFSSFFPQVVSGPIPRGAELLPQFAKPRCLTPDGLARAGSALLVGFILKFLLADTLARGIVNPVFAEPEAFSAVGAWGALVGYALQVFGDFAGYSLIAIGLGRLFGIELPENFRFPFFSTNMMEFWRRWHITLNRFLFDYLYWPLVGSHGWFRKRMDLGFFGVFALSGLWHGATWNFVLWGALHGIALSVHRRFDVAYRGLCRKDRAWVARRRTRTWAAVAWILTQGFFVVSLLPFRTRDLPALGMFARRLVALDGRHHALGGQPVIALSIVAAVAFLAIWHLLQWKRLAAAQVRLANAPAPLRGVFWGLVIVTLLLLSPVGGGTFIYAQF